MAKAKVTITSHIELPIEYYDPNLNNADSFRARVCQDRGLVEELWDACEVTIEDFVLDPPLKTGNELPAGWTIRELVYPDDTGWVVRDCEGQVRATADTREQAIEEALRPCDGR